MTDYLALNDLETRRFGVVAAKLDGSAGELPELSRVGAEARARGIELVSTRVDCRAVGRVQALEDDGFRLMDCLVSYARALADIGPAPELPGSCVLRPADAGDVAAVGAVARDAFRNYIGHYHADPRLPNAAADEAYVEWAETCIGRDDTRVLVAAEGQRVRGFLALRRNGPAECDIVLNAVAPEAQRRGYYGALLAKALEEARSQGATRIVTSTQIGNLAVQRLWVRQGFVMTGAVYTLHRWYATPSAPRER
ncbi:MAG: GNAT family N-acetyltransferase [Maritimibacter sp.]|nr:GNAT family N-acetyltransferase [Maritimibacter sp.]